MNNKKIFNILSNIFDTSHRILLHTNTGLFYDVLDQIKSCSIYRKNNENIAYSCIISTDPLGLSQELNSLSLKEHINTIIFIDNICPNILKKEDKYILKQKIKEAYKIFCSEEIARSWGFDINEDKLFFINYGVNVDRHSTHSKNVCVLNFNKNDNMTLIHKIISSKIDQCSIITAENDIKNTMEAISDHKIVINPYGPYHSLKICSMGCYCISVYPNIDPGITTYEQITDYSDIVDKLNNILQNYQNIKNMIPNVLNHIETKYNTDMSNQVLQILELIKTKASCYAA